MWICPSELLTYTGSYGRDGSHTVPTVGQVTVKTSDFLYLFTFIIIPAGHIWKASIYVLLCFVFFVVYGAPHSSFKSLFSCHGKLMTSPADDAKTCVWAIAPWPALLTVLALLLWRNSVMHSVKSACNISLHACRHWPVKWTYSHGRLLTNDSMHSHSSTFTLQKFG